MPASTTSGGADVAEERTQQQRQPNVAPAHGGTLRCGRGKIADRGQETTEYPGPDQRAR